MSKNKVNQLTNHTCLRCGHKWIPRKLVTKVCPECKTPYWDKPKEPRLEKLSVSQ